ncbi:MAG: c-type cytochrome [Thermoanaerobaculia bacterium]
MTAKRILGLIAVAFIAGVSALPAQVDDENPGFMAAKGRVTFRRYCASCHGEKAEGNGPVAKMLKIPPSDLRVLKHESDGEFPADRITAWVDGREEVAAHGRRDMPVWGEVFQTSLIANPAAPDEDGEARAARKVRELVLFLETIQITPEDNGEDED